MAAPSGLTEIMKAVTHPGRRLESHQRDLKYYPTGADAASKYLVSNFKMELT